jgi:exonuclease VII large subunit
MINIRKHSPSDAKTMHTPSKQTSKLNTKRREHSSTDSKQHRIKQHRSSLNNINLPSPTVSSKIKSNINCGDDELIRLKNANDLLIREVQSLISTSTQSIEKANHNDISHLQNEYERLNTQMINLRNQSIDANLNRLHNDVENLLKQIKNLQPIKTFADELFEKYTIEYILSLNEHDVQQRLEQLEKENQLLLLIKQVR